MDQERQLRRCVEEFREQGYEAICFWLPALSVGGGVLYFCDMARYLQEHTDLNVYYMDYKEGYAAQSLKDSGIKFLEYREEDDDFPVQEKCVIFLNSTRAIQIKRMRSDNKFLIWHYETVPCAWDRLFLQGETKAYLQLCQDEHAMVFHDWSSRDILNRQYDMNFQELNYLRAIPSLRVDLKSISGLIAEDEIHIAWLGRIALDKVQSIYYIIRNFSAYKTDKKKFFHIVGDGWKMQELRAYAKKYMSRIEFQFTGMMPNDRLSTYLLKNADILFAMGTSVLEGASRGIPSVVVQLNSTPIIDDEYFWIFNTKEYCLGILPVQKESFDVKFSCMDEILDDIYLEGKKAEYAEKSHSYYVEKFSDYHRLVCDFFIYINQSTLTFDKFEQCIKYVPYNHMTLHKINVFGKTIQKKLEHWGELK